MRQADNCSLIFLTCLSFYWIVHPARNALIDRLFPVNGADKHSCLVVGVLLRYDSLLLVVHHVNITCHVGRKSLVLCHQVHILFLLIGAFLGYVDPIVVSWASCVSTKSGE